MSEGSCPTTDETMRKTGIRMNKFKQTFHLYIKCGFQRIPLMKINGTINLNLQTMQKRVLLKSAQLSYSLTQLIRVNYMYMYLNVAFSFKVPTPSNKYKKLKHSLTHIAFILFVL